MNQQIENAFERAERALSEGRSISGTGFWKAVEAIRRDPGLAETYADRAGAIDMRAFETAVRLRVPSWVGTVLLGAGTLLGLGLLLASGALDGLWKPLVFLAGFGILDVASHSLAHWAVGRLVGMRFTHYFLGGPPPPRPGAKLDYASYLRVPARRRALMHASGALVTKAVPFLCIPAAASFQMPRWVFLVLILVGVFQMLTDIVFSTRSSDWKKVRRELKAST